MDKPKPTRREEFEADMSSLFGERNTEFSPKLREMLYQLWREGEKRGCREERTRQSDSLANHKGPMITPEADIIRARLREVAGVHSVGEKPKKDFRSTFGKVLAGDEPILKVPESRFPEVTVPDFLLETRPNREFFGEWVVQNSQKLGTVNVPTKTTMLKPSLLRLPPLKTQRLQPKKKKLNAKPK